jgi:hypothetical protein
MEREVISRQIGVSARDGISGWSGWLPAMGALFRRAGRLARPATARARCGRLGGRLSRYSRLRRFRRLGHGLRWENIRRGRLGAGRRGLRSGLSEGFLCERSGFFLHGLLGYLGSFHCRNVWQWIV